MCIICQIFDIFIIIVIYHFVVTLLFHSSTC